MRNTKICIATSTRADWGLLAPLARALQSCTGIELQILATNMHLLDRYGHTEDEITKAGFTITERVYMDDTDDNPVSKAAAMAQCLTGTAHALELMTPDLLVVLGDRYEMLAVASAATVMKVPIVHIAGGEISEGAIDDNIRHAITKLSALHFTATEAYRQRVIQMGENPERVINAGALGVWNILNQKLMSCDELSDSLGFAIIPGQTLLVTYHPATLDDMDVATQCRNMLDALDHYPDYRIVITYPNNDAGSDQIIAQITDYARCNSDRVLLIKSLGMKRYLSLLQYAAAVIGNSSSGIVEVPSMGIPTVDIGIRQRGRIAAPSVIHCGNSTDQIVRAIAQATSPEMAQLAAKRQNPYAHGDTVAMMVDTLTHIAPSTLLQKRFHNL